MAEGVLDCVWLVAQDGEMGLLHTLLATHGTPNWGLSQFIKQSLEDEFSEVRLGSAS
jgi:hypothetical protein